MDEKDPRDYRGGAHEPAEVKGGSDTWADSEGVVPREDLDETGGPPPERAGDDQALADASLGQNPGSEPTDDSIDENRGDEADATSYSGTGGNVKQTGEEIEEGEPASWVQGANVAAADTDQDVQGGSKT